MNNAHHYFGSTAFNWAVAATREEVLVKLAREAGSDIIKRNVKRNGGLYCWTCRVELPQTAPYDIGGYAPQGVPRSEEQACLLVNTKGSNVAPGDRTVAA